MSARDARFQLVVERLLAETAASRATVRRSGDAGSAVLVAEACAPGVGAMGDDPVPGVVEAPTYRFLAERRELLIQDDLTTDPVAPPASLIDKHRVLAQMLAPVFLDDAMVATISVHEQDRARAWVPSDVEALRRAQSAVLAAILEEPRA